MPVEPNLLTQFSPFSLLSGNALEQLASYSQIKRFPSAQIVMAHHTVPAFLVVVVRGQLQKTEVSEDGRITGIALVNVGQILDWLSVVDGAPVIWSVNTTRESELLLVPIQNLRQLLNDDTRISLFALQEITRELRRATEQRQLLTLPNAFQRVFVQIVQIAEQTPTDGLANLPKQHEIAAMVNTSRETVSRAIQLLVKNGILVKNGHRFAVQGTDQLKKLAMAGTSSPVSSHPGKARDEA